MPLLCSTRACDSHTYAVTIVRSQRMRISQREAKPRLMIDTFYRYRAGARFLLHGFVIIRDHICICSSRPPRRWNRRLDPSKGRFSFAVRQQYRWPVWQDGYYAHRVMNEQDYRSQLAYIAANPARKGLGEYAFVHTQPEYEVDATPPHLSG